MSEVRIKENESLDNALKRFKRQCAKAGVLAEVRKREHYEKPSVKRKKKSEAARKRKCRYMILVRTHDEFSQTRFSQISHDSSLFIIDSLELSVGNWFAGIENIAKNIVI